MKIHSSVSALVELMTTSNGGSQNRTISALNLIIRCVKLAT